VKTISAYDEKRIKKRQQSKLAFFMSKNIGLNFDE